MPRALSSVGVVIALAALLGGALAQSAQPPPGILVGSITATPGGLTISVSSSVHAHAEYGSTSVADAASSSPNATFTQQQAGSGVGTGTGSSPSYTSDAPAASQDGWPWPFSGRTAASAATQPVVVNLAPLPSPTPSLILTHTEDGHTVLDRVASFDFGDGCASLNVSGLRAQTPFDVGITNPGNGPLPVLPGTAVIDGAAVQEDAYPEGLTPSVGLDNGTAPLHLYGYSWSAAANSTGLATTVAGDVISWSKSGNALQLNASIDAGHTFSTGPTFALQGSAPGWVAVAPDRNSVAAVAYLAPVASPPGGPVVSDGSGPALVRWDPTNGTSSPPEEIPSSTPYAAGVLGFNAIHDATFAGELRSGNVAAGWEFWTLPQVGPPVLSSRLSMSPADATSAVLSHIDNEWVAVIPGPPSGAENASLFASMDAARSWSSARSLSGTQGWTNLSVAIDSTGIVHIVGLRDGDLWYGRYLPTGALLSESRITGAGGLPGSSSGASDPHVTVSGDRVWIFWVAPAGPSATHVPWGVESLDSGASFLIPYRGVLDPGSLVHGIVQNVVRLENPILVNGNEPLLAIDETVNATPMRAIIPVFDPAPVPSLATTPLDPAARGNVSTLSASGKLALELDPTGGTTLIPGQAHEFFVTVEDIGAGPLMNLALALNVPGGAAVAPIPIVSLAPGEHLRLPLWVTLPADASSSGVATLTASYAGAAPATLATMQVSTQTASTSTPIHTTSWITSPPAEIAAGGAVAAGLLGLVLLTEPGRWGLLGPLGALYTRLRRSEVLGHELRGRIHERISAAPGIRFEELRRALDLSTGVLSYHLRVLEREGYVRCAVHWGRPHYYTVEAASAAASSAPAGDLITHALGSEPLTSEEIAARLGVSRQRVRYHLRALEAQGRVQSLREGRRVRYRLMSHDAASA
ncbi:MAG: helix-turn-helix domain-containing protein [Thermoplasmatota archaeon]